MIKTLTFIPGVLLLALMLFAGGCEIDRYNVILVIDAKDYHSSMKWTEIREAGFRDLEAHRGDKKCYLMRLSDADGHPIPLFRFMHESRSLMPLNEGPIVISTPIIIEKKYMTFNLTISGHDKDAKTLSVNIHELTACKDDPDFYVLPVDLR